MSYKLLRDNHLRGVRQSEIMSMRSRHLPAMRLSGVTAHRAWLYL